MDVLGSHYCNGLKLVECLYSSGVQYWFGTSVWEIFAVEELMFVVGVVCDG